MEQSWKPSRSTLVAVAVAAILFVIVMGAVRDLKREVRQYRKATLELTQSAGSLLIAYPCPETARLALTNGTEEVATLQVTRPGLYQLLSSDDTRLPGPDASLRLERQAVMIEIPVRNLPVLRGVALIPSLSCAANGK